MRVRSPEGDLLDRFATTKARTRAGAPALPPCRTAPCASSRSYAGVVRTGWRCGQLFVGKANAELTRNSSRAPWRWCTRSWPESPRARLGHDRVHQRQGARELFASIPHSLSQRRVARSATRTHNAGIRPAGGTGAAFGLAFGLEHPLWFAPLVVANLSSKSPSGDRTRMVRWRRSAWPCATRSVCLKSRHSPSTRSRVPAPPVG